MDLNGTASDSVSRNRMPINSKKDLLGDNEGSEKVELKKKVGLTSGIALIVGTMIGEYLVQ